MSKVRCKLTKKMKGVFIVKVDAMHIDPRRKIPESFIIPFKENSQMEMLKNITSKILDELPMSLSQTQKEQIWYQCPNSVPKNDCLYYNGEPAQNTLQKW